VTAPATPREERREVWCSTCLGTGRHTLLGCCPGCRGRGYTVVWVPTTPVSG
jgi:DnaJ-class molecular chaperone